ncbi:MAG: hypothetical protein ACXW16_00720 [Burkholderiaceae bacterium]
MMSRLMSCAAALMLLADVLMPCAMAQTPEADRQREYYRELDRQREEQQRRAQEEFQRQQRATEEARKREQQLDHARTMKNIEEDRSKPRAQAAPSGQSSPDMRSVGPKLPAERNVLLGSWRVESGSQGGGVTGLGQGKGTDRNAMARELLTSLSNPCALMFGNGITFAPSTYSIQALDGSVFRGSVDYRSTQKQVIEAITQETWKTLSFEIEGPNRIVWGRFGCALTRVGALGPNAGANATTAPGNARTGAANSSAPPAAGAMPQVAAVAPTAPRSTLARPSPEVCRDTLLDQLGKVGINQVRALSDRRFKEPEIEGKVPNTNNLRIDLRGSACDDPRIKATLYDFDADGMLQSITYVWDRPPGPAPAPIFSERVTQLSRLHSLPPSQSPGRLQADTSLGRLILEDLPERNLLLEAYKAKK